MDGNPNLTPPQPPQPRASTSILPTMDAQNQLPINTIIEHYLLHNLADPQSQALKPDVTSIEYLNSQSYVGELEGGRKQGRGIYRYSNSDVYMGDWWGDGMEGLGMYLWANGDLYRGLFHSGASTRGIMLYANGDVYEGDFQDGYRHGRGLMKYARANHSHHHNNNHNNNQEETHFEQYNGQWRQNRRHGTGTFKCKQYEVTGRWENDELKGQAIIKSVVYSDNTGFYFYFNGVMDGMRFMEGMGIFKYSGFNYEGVIHDGKFNGQGKYSWTNSSRSGVYLYQGQFKQGRIEGKGKLKLLKSNTIANTQDQFDPHISDYQGHFHKSRINGHGKIVYQNKDIYQGLFKDGYRHESGVYRFANGDVYEGEFNMDVMEGFGMYRWAGRVLVYEGKFQANRIVDRQMSSLGGTHTQFGARQKV